MSIDRREILKMGSVWFGRIAVGAGASAVALTRDASAQGGYESWPVLRAKDLVPAELLTGPGFTVDDEVPVKGLLGYFTLRADVGTFVVHGAELLRVRVAEAHALKALEDRSQTETFLKAAAGAAARPVEAAAGLVLNPVETVRELPGGVSRFFDRVEMGAKSLEESASAANRSDTERAADITQRVGSISADALGYEKERRDLAKSVKVDPYTTNPVLAKKLSDMAWVAFSGRVSVNALVSVFVPGSILLTAVSTTNTWIWDTPPADLIKQAQDRFLATGASPEQVATLLKNRWFSLSVLSGFSQSLDQLAPAKGRADVVALAATAENEDHARFVAHATADLAARHQGGERIASLSARGTVVARTAGGAVVVPGPVDYVPWTKGVADFAGRADLKARKRTIALRGHTSPRARKDLTARGWAIAEGVKSARS